MILTCIVSGIEKRVAKASREKGIKQFGSLEEYAAYFVCREAKKLLKQRMQPEEVQQKLLPKGKKPFSIDRGVLIKLKLLKKPKKGFKREDLLNVKIPNSDRYKSTSFQQYVEGLTEHSCLRPDIFLNNGRCCTGCPYLEFCICKSKKLKPGRR